MIEGVFVSYRRDDAPGHAGRLYDRLVTRFGEDRVFMDVDSIDPGEDFVEAIESTLASASVVIVVIGPAWVTLRDEQGVVRLTKPNDYVHLEVSRALELRKRVIPVLVADAQVPDVGELPADLHALTRRNAIEISDGRFHSDADRLADAIAESLAGAAAATPPTAAGVPGSAAVAAGTAAAAGAAAPTEAPVAPAPPAPASDGLGDRLRRLGLPVVIAVLIALLMVVGAIVWVLSSGDDDTTTATTAVTTEATTPATTTATTTESTAGSTTGVTEAPQVVPPSVVGELPTSGEPAEVTVAGGALWAAIAGGVERFDQPGPDAQPAGTVGLGSPGLGNDIIEWDGALYVTRFAGRALAAVDLATGTVRGAPIPINGSPIAGVVSGDTLWLAVHGSSTGAAGSVVAVRGGAVVDQIDLASTPNGIETLDGRLWVTFHSAGSIGIIDPVSHQVTVSSVGAKPVDVRLIGGQLWVTVSGENRIALIDPAGGTETGSIQVGQSPWKVEEGFGAVWVTNQGDGTVVRIDPSTLEVGEPIPVGARPDEIAVGTDHLYVGNVGSRSISVIDPG